MQKVRTVSPYCLGRQLDAHAEVDLVVGKRQAQLSAAAGKPFGAAAAGRCDAKGAVGAFAVAQAHTVAPAVERRDALDWRAEAELAFVLHAFVKIGQNLDVALGAQVLAARLQKMQVMCQRLPFKQTGLG